MGGGLLSSARVRPATSLTRTRNEHTSSCHARRERGLANTRDIIAFLRIWAARDAGADWDSDGDVDRDDVLEFLDDWAAGCA